MLFYVYIIYSEKLDKFYIGTTDNVLRRLDEHNSGLYQSSFTRRGIPWQLYLEVGCSSSKEAYWLESFIKQMKSRAFYHKLKETPEFIDDIKKKYRD
jgi:putative endonuclease